jgi:CheY-like chemotaxis protein
VLCGPEAPTAPLVTRHTLREQHHSLTVLVAEDNPVNQRVAEAMLVRAGHTVVPARSGVETLELLSRQKFDAVLMDVQMPEMDGIETTRRIRESERTTGRHLPIIAMTAHALEEDRKKCLEAGMDDYVSKPVTSERLLNALGKITVGAVELIRPEIPPATETLSERKLLEMVGGDRELLRDLCGLFLQQVPELMDAIVSSISGGDLKTLERSAHKLKGSLKTFGAEKAALHASRLEDVGRSGDLSRAEPMLGSLHDELARLRPLLEAISRRLEPAKQRSV